MKRKNYIYGIACGLASVVLAGCVEELPEERRALSGRGIGFSTSVVNGWDEPSETRASRSASVGDPVQMEGGRQTLYLHAEVVDGISLHKFPAMDQASSTRGVMREASNLYDSFGVLGYSFTGSWDGSQTPVLMYNVEASKGSSVYETGVYWPGSDENVRFYAYAPYSEADGVEGLSVSDASLAGAPKLTYEVPADVTKQSDLLATLCDETATQDHTSPQSLEFHHLLTAVCFKIGDGMAAGTINKITLKNIKYKGTYAFPAAAPWTSDKGSWAVDDDMKDFSCSPNFTTDGTANVQVNTGEDVFMMLPQTLGDDAVVEVEFTDASSNTDTYSATIKGLSAWEQGKTTTYAISLDSNAPKYILTVSLDKATYPAEGDDGTLSVTSYKITDGTKEALTWTITGFSTDGGTTWRESPSTNLKDNEVIDFADVSGTGGEAAQDQAFSVYYTAYDVTVPQTSDLTDAEPADNMDLSLYDVEGHPISRSTANCYVVRAPGTYKFPVVYGNGIKNGVETDNGYKSGINPDTVAEFKFPIFESYDKITDEVTTNSTQRTISKETRLKYTLLNFPNSYGEKITSPWIHNNTHDGVTLTPTKAELVWADAENLIRQENVGLAQSGDGYYVTFEIKKEDIREGNALLQVKGADDTVLWSWHIWVTNADFSKSTSVTATPTSDKINTYPKLSLNYTFMAVPLGCIDEPKSQYSFEAREVFIKVKQAESDKEAIVRLQQPEKEEVSEDRMIRMTNYQWGRKDPFPYKQMDEVVTQAQKVPARITVYEAIRHPDTFYWFEYGNTGGGNTEFWFRSNGENLDYPGASGSEDGIVNLWDINLLSTGIHDEYWKLPYTAQSVTKSIYDPCPVGYHVADPWTFIGFCYHPWNFWGNNDPSIEDIATRQAGIGNTYHMKYNGTNVDLFMPVTNIRYGYQSGRTPQPEATSSLYYWTAGFGASGQLGGLYYYANSTSARTNYGNSSTANGFAVYPIKDE